MPEQSSAGSNSGPNTDYLNVNTTVGKNGANKNGDVYLVQAMFYEILPYVYGISPEEIPYPTGTYDRRTESLILKYQLESSLSRGVKVWKDGFINRAVGSHVPGKTRVWTITYMNEDLYYTHASNGYEGNYVQWFVDKYTGLSYYFGNYEYTGY